MAAGKSVATQYEELYASIREKSCSYCGGDLVIGEFKDQTAILCEECDTPAVRTWSVAD